MKDKSSPRVLESMHSVVRRTSLSRGWINKLRKTGDFPAAVMLGEKRFAFVESEVDAWIEARMGARGAKKLPSGGGQ